MLKNTARALAILMVFGSVSVVTAATTKQLVQHEGWRGLLCHNEVPDCVCKYCCPDYCKKPLPCPCGKLPPNLSCGCGPTRWWGFGCRRQSCCDGQVDCGNCVSKKESTQKPIVKCTAETTEQLDHTAASPSPDVPPGAESTGDRTDARPWQR